MRNYLLVFILFFSAPAMAQYAPMDSSPNDLGHWALGFGFGTEADFDSVGVIEIKTPRLFQWGYSNFSLLLSAESKEVSGINKWLTPVHLLFDISYPTYKEVVRSYIRLGGGAVIIDDSSILPEEAIFNFQIQFGFEVISFMVPGGSHGTAFVQAMINHPGMRNPPLNGFEIFDGTSVVVGVRHYF